MSNIKNLEANVPLTVPQDLKTVYLENLKKITKNTENLFLFAGDQKVEHLNKDFYGKNISLESNSPEHLFKIASKGKVGCFATQLGLIAQYGNNYRDINYIIKLNSKTDIVSTKYKEPVSALLNTVEDVITFKKNSGLNIVGIGFTIYLGSLYEDIMLSQAAQAILHAHQNGLVAMLWIYPRGKSVKDELDPELIIGACGVASCLGADFVKINNPGIQYLKQAVVAAGKTKVVIAGGKQKDQDSFLQDIYNNIKTGGVAGCAVGRNIHQKDFDSALRLCKAINGIVYEDIILNDAKKYLRS